MSLEIVREIQRRLVQRSSLAQEKRDQEPAHAAVAVEERMYRLELSVGESDLDEERDTVAFVQKGFEIRESVRHFVRWRRHECGVCQRGAPRPEPVLAASQLARRQVRSANAMQKILVNFTNQ